MFDSNGTCLSTTYSRFVAFEDYINALQLTVSEAAVFYSEVRFNGSSRPYFSAGLNAVGDSFFAGLTSFQRVPQMVDYRGQKEADFMIIKDLGEITTQEQLNNLVTLSSGTYKFTSPYELTVNQVPQHKFEFIVTEATDKTYNYVMSMISDGFKYRQDIACDKISRQIYRQGNINFASNAGYILDSANDIDFGTRMAQIKAPSGLIFNPDGSGSVLFRGHTQHNSGVDFYDRATFDGEVNFKKRFNVPTNHIEFSKPVAWSSELTPFPDTTDVAIRTDPPNFNNEYVYGEINTLSLYGSYDFGIDDFIGIHFDTGEVAPSVSYQMAGNGLHLNWIGTDCALDGGISIFAPQSNMHYDVYLYTNGTHLIGKVDGFVPATGNSVEE